MVFQLYGTSYSNNLMKADLLNKQFSSVFTTNNLSSLPELGPAPYPDISQIEISTDGNLITSSRARFF